MKTSYPILAVLLLFCALPASSELAAQTSAESEINFFRDVYAQQDKKLHDFLLTELHFFLEKYPQSQFVDDAYTLLAKVYRDKGDEHRALAVCFKTVYLFPDATQHEECVKIAQSIIAEERSYSEKGGTLLPLLQGSSSSDTALYRYYDYLDFLMELDEPDLYEWTLSEARYFLSQYGEAAHTDNIIKWMADVYVKMKNPSEAVATYLKLSYLYPQSSLLPYADYQRGALLSSELGAHEKSIEVLASVVMNYPESNYGGMSLFEMATIKENKLRDYPGAMDEYQKLVDTYPDDKRCVDALLAVADLNYARLKDYPAALEAYAKIVSDYQSHSKAVEALEKTGEIYERRLGEYAKASDAYAKIAEMFPFYEKAPDMLYKAGEIQEDELQDIAQAINYYQKVIDTFPEHRKARDAAKKLERLKN